MYGTDDILSELLATQDFTSSGFGSDYTDQSADWLDEIAREAYYETLSIDRTVTPETDSVFGRALEWINPFDRDAGLRFGPDPENPEAERIRRLFGTGVRTLPGALGSALQYASLKTADSGDRAAQHIYETYGVMEPEEDTRPLEDKLADSGFLSWLNELGEKGRAWSKDLLEAAPPPEPLDEEALVGEGRYGYLVPKITQSVEDLVQNIPMQIVLKVPAIIGGAITANPVTYSIINSSAESAVEAGELIESVLENGGTYDEALKAADSVFSKNMMLLTPTNILEGGLLLGGGNLTSGLKKMFSSSQLSKMEPLVNTLHAYVKAHPNLVTISKGISATATQIGQEGLEEGLQYAFQRQAQGDTRPVFEILDDPESWRSMRAGGLMGGVLGIGGTVRANVQETIAKEDRQRILTEVKRQEEEARGNARALKEKLDRTDAQAVRTEASSFAARDINRRAREYVERERESILSNVEDEYKAETNVAIDRLLEEGELNDILVALPEILDEVRVGREGINPGEEIFIPNRNESGRAVEVDGESLVYLTTKENGEPVLRRISIHEAEPLGPGESVEWTDDSGNYRYGIVEKRNFGSVTVRPTDIKTTQSVNIPNELVTARRDAGKRAGMPVSVRGDDAIAAYEQRHPAPKIIKPVTPVQSPVEPEVGTPVGISEQVVPVEEAVTEQPFPVGALEETAQEVPVQQLIPTPVPTPIPNLSQDMRNNPFTTRLFADLVRSRKKILSAADEGKLDYAFIKDMLYGKGAHKTMRSVDEKAANDAVTTLASNPDEVVRLLNDTEFINTTLGNTGHFMTGYWGNKARVAPIAYQGIFRKGYKPSRILDVFGGSGYVSNLLNRTIGEKQIPVVLNDANPETMETHKTVKDNTNAVVNLMKRYQSQTKKMWDDTHGKKMDLTEAERQFRAKYDSWWKDRRAEAQTSRDPVVKTVWKIMSNDGSLAVGDDSQRVANAGKTTKKPFERLGDLVRRVQDASEQYNSSAYTLTNKDALEILQEAKPGDLVVIDPPYIAAPEMYNRESDSPWLDEIFVERVIKQRLAPLVERGVDVIFHDNASPGLVSALEEAGFETRTFPRQSQNTGKDAQFVNEVVGFTTGLKQPTQIPSTSGQRAAAAMPVKEKTQIEAPEVALEKATGQIPSSEEVVTSEGPPRSPQEELPGTALEEGEIAPIRSEDVGAVKEKRTGAEWARRYKDVVKLSDTNGWDSVDDFTNTEITKDEFSDRLSRTGHEWTGRQGADETLMPVFVNDVKQLREQKQPKAEVTEVAEPEEETPEIQKVQKPKTFSKETRGLVTGEENDRYIEAVEAEDMETAEKLVENAARNAEWGILRKYPDGNERDVRVFTHATNRDFRSFDRNAEPATDEGWIGKGFYFHYGKEETSPYGERMVHAFLKLDNPYTGSISEIEDAVIESGVSEDDNVAFAQAMHDELVRRGYDGVVTSGEVVAFNPEQIKSAESVTYDENGNVIPLTERFNPETQDIYYTTRRDEARLLSPENTVVLEDLTKDTSRPFYVEDKAKRSHILGQIKPTDRQEELRRGLLYGNHDNDMNIGDTRSGNPIVIARKSARISSSDYTNNVSSPERPGLATVLIGEKGDMVYVFHRFTFNDGKYGIESEYSRPVLGSNGVFRFEELERPIARFFAGDSNDTDFDGLEVQAKKIADLMNAMNKRGELVLPSQLEKGKLTASESFDKEIVSAVKEIHKSLNMDGATEMFIHTKDIMSFDGLIKYGGLTWNTGLIEFLANANHAGAAFSPTDGSINPETGHVMDDPRVGTIVMNVDDPVDIITNFGHEIGHHLFNIVLTEDVVGSDLIDSFIDSYRKYLHEAEASPEVARHKFLENAFAASSLEDVEGGHIGQVVRGEQDSIVKYYTNHEGGIHEYFANNVSRWVQTNQKPKTAIEKVYADVARRLKNIIESVKKALRRLGISDRYGVDPTVEDIINAFRLKTIDEHYGDGQIRSTSVRGVMMIPKPDENGKFNLDVLKKYGLNRAMDTPTPEMQAEDRSTPPDIPDEDGLFDVRKSFRYGDEKAKDPRTPLQRFRGTVHEQYRLWSDQLDALRRLQTAIERTEGTYAKDEWAVYDYARVVVGSMENAEQFVTRIHHLLRHVDSNRADAFIGYMVAEHATDFINPATGEFYPDSPVIYDKSGNKMTAKDAIQYVESHNDEFGEIAQAVRMHYNMAMYRTLVGSGLMTHDTFEKMRLMYPNYVPFFKDINSKMLEHFIKGDTKKLIQIQKGIQELKGTDVKELLKNPLESMVRNIAVFHTIAARNKVHERLVNISNRKGFEWVASPVEKPSHAGRNPVFSMWKNGEKIYFTTDNDIYNALTAFEKHESDSFNAVFALSEEVNKLFKKGTTRWNPVFLIRNLWKDPFEVSRNTQFWSPPFYHTFKGLIYLIDDAVSVRKGYRGNKHVRAFREGGGFSSGLVERMAPKKVAQDIRSQFHKSPVEQSRSLLNPRTWLEFIGNINQFVEMAPKIAEYQMLTDSKRFKDMPDVRKIRLAREVNIDFGRAGLFGKVANRHIAFFNPALQSIDKFVRAFQEGATPKERANSFARASMKSILYVTLPSMLLWMFNHRDPETAKEYEELPQDMRDRYWIAKFGDIWLRAPKPFEYGMLYGTLAERWLDDQYTDDPDAWRLFAKHTWESLAPPFVPTLIGPWIESGMNNDLFFDRPIIPESKKNLPRNQQFGPGTSEVAKKFANSFIGKSLDISPYHVDHYIKAYLGGVGQGTLSTLDIFAEMLGVRPQGPEKTAAELPFIRGFTIIPFRRSESVSRFYDYYDELEQGHMGARAEKSHYEHENLYKMFGKTRRELSEIWKHKNNVRESERIAPEKKRVLMDEIDNKAVIIASKALDDYYRIIRKEAMGR